MGGSPIYLFPVLTIPRADVRDFWIKLLKLALPLAFLAVVMEFRLAQAPNSYRMKDHSLRRQGDAIQVLALGSSHAIQGIRPDVFPVPLFNLANVSQSLILDEKLFQRYAPQLPNLRCVIVTISDFTLDYRMSASPEAWRDAFYHRYYGVTEKLHWWNQGWRLSDVSAYLLYGTTDARRALWSPSWQNAFEGYQENGWFRVPRPPLAASIESDAQSRVDFLNSCMNRRWRPGNVAALYRLIADARKRHVDVVLVTLPVHESYAKRISPDHWQTALGVIRSICSQEHVRYLNHFQDPRFTAADFSDSDHLNEEGAARISRILAAEIGL